MNSVEINLPSRLEKSSGKAMIDLLINSLVFLTITILFWGIIGSLSNWRTERIESVSSVNVQKYFHEKDGVSSYIAGEVKNITYQNLAYVKIVFALYGEGGEFMGTAFDQIYDLNSEETAKFKALFPPGLEINKYSLVFAEGWDPWE